MSRVNLDYYFKIYTRDIIELGGTVRVKINHTYYHGIIQAITPPWVYCASPLIHWHGITHTNHPITSLSELLKNLCKKYELQYQIKLNPDPELLPQPQVNLSDYDYFWELIKTYGLMTHWEQTADNIILHITNYNHSPHPQVHYCQSGIIGQCDNAHYQIQAEHPLKLYTGQPGTDWSHPYPTKTPVTYVFPNILGTPRIKPSTTQHKVNDHLGWESSHKFKLGNFKNSNLIILDDHINFKQNHYTQHSHKSTELITQNNICFKSKIGNLSLKKSCTLTSEQDKILWQSKAHTQISTKNLKAYSFKNTKLKTEKNYLSQTEKNYTLKAQSIHWQNQKSLHWEAKQFLIESHGEITLGNPLANLKITPAGIVFTAREIQLSLMGAYI